MSFARHRRTSYLALAAAVALGLSACASTTSASKAKPTSSSSATAAKSVHIKGAFIEKGQKLQIDVAGDRAGKNTRVIVNDGTNTIETLTTGGKTYIKANAAYWTKNASAAAAKLAADKYVTIPAGSAPSMDSLQVGTLLDKTLAKDMTAVQKLNTKVEKTEVNGVHAYLITDKITSDGSKVYASADGQAHLLRIESPKGQGSLDFTEWDAVGPMSPPPADQLVKLPGL